MEKSSWTDGVRTEKILQKIQGGQECSTNNKNKEGSLDWSHLA
jgi:uncharacterized membrane protein